MDYDNLSTSALKEFHRSIQRCLQTDDSTPSGKMKPYGVREFNDWAEHLQKIEALLTNRQEKFTPIVLASIASPQRTTPIEAVLYERIKQCLEYEDKISPGNEKPYGVREFSDWRRQADSFEKILDSSGHIYSKIVW